MKKERNDLVIFLIGVLMLAAGLYWFTSSVTVSTGFYNFRGLNTGGMIIVPFIVGIAWLFAKPDSMGAKLVIVVGVVIVLASIIAGTRFIFRNRNLYEYLLMLVFIAGGAALTLKVLLAKPKDKEVINKDNHIKTNDYHDINKELEDLKKKY